MLGLSAFQQIGKHYLVNAQKNLTFLRRKYVGTYSTIFKSKLALMGWGV